MNTRLKAASWVTGLLFISSVILAGCGGQSAPSVKNSSAARKNNPSGLYREVGSWPLPPQYQGNPFGSGGVGSAYTFVYSGLFQVVRSTDKVYGRIAESTETPTQYKTIVHIRHDVRWSDGQPFTSKDVWAYYMLNNATELTHYLTGIETPDPYTVIFHWANPAPIDQLKQLFIAQDKQDTIPYHYYQQWVDKADSLLKQAQPETDPKTRGKAPFGLKITADLQKQINDNWTDFTKHAPTYPLGTGAYVVKQVTATDMILEPNPYYYDHQRVKFKNIHLKLVEDLNQQYALIKAGQIDRMDSTPPRDILESILSSNENLVHYQMLGTGSTGFVFNTAHQPFDNQTFRQAVVYALDRKKIREVANYYAVETDLSAAGMSQSYVPQWVSPDTLSKFTKYPHDAGKATKLLKSIGWTKGKDGVWVDKNGKSYNFLIGAPSNNAWFVNCGEILAEQLSNFGLPTKFMAVDSSIYYDNANNNNGAYDMSIDFVDISWDFTFPWSSMRNAYWNTSWKEGHLPNNGNGEAKFVAKGYDGQTIDVSQLLHQIPYMQNETDRVKAIDEISYVTNESAWIVNLFQNVTGTWYNMKSIGGVPWANSIQKYQRDMPLPTADQTERIAETNEGFSSDQWLIDGSYYPS